MAAPIFIDVEKTLYAPGETIRGKVLWALGERPKRLKISLGWWTEGKGTRDAEVIAESEWATDETAGERTFDFSVPEGPYSFQGHLITLQWALEVTVEQGPEAEILDLVISPTGVPVELPLVDARSNKPFSFRRNR